MWLLELRIEYLVLKGKTEDSKRLIRSRKLMKDRKYTDHRKTTKRTSNDLQTTLTRTRTPLKSVVNSGALEG